MICKAIIFKLVCKFELDDARLAKAAGVIAKMFDTPISDAKWEISSRMSGSAS